MTQLQPVSLRTTRPHHKATLSPLGLLLPVWKVTLSALILCAGLAAPVSAADDIADKVQAHLSAGEYGPALNLAQSIKDEAARSALLQKIVETQVAAGDFKAAELASRQEAAPERRGRMRTEITRKRDIQGGGSQANFGPLIQLIQRMTGGEQTGPWGDSGDPNGGGDDTGTDGEGGRGEMIPFMNGVWVDPQGLLRQDSKQELAAHLALLGVKARAANLNEEMSRPSSLRFVSLTRLEKEVAARLQAGQPVLETMRRLAGLTQVQYIFAIPEENELIIAGPAEGWNINQHGLPVGQSSGRPVLQLDDLVTLLRTFGPGGRGIFGCSIDPRPAHLKATKEFIDGSATHGPLAPNAVSGWMRQIEDRMGLQDIVIYGVPADSRVARVIIDADYRMKLIGIGKLKNGAGIPSVFDLMVTQKEKDKLPLNALRWWLTMNYSSVLHSADKNVYEMKGSSVLVKSEDQMISAAGDHVPTGKASAVNQKFAENFTQRYQELARRDLVFADLQNLFDMGMVAALMRTEGLAQKAGWNMGVFAQNGAYQPAHWPAPQAVKSVINHRVYGDSEIVVQVAGGVRADMVALIKSQEIVKSSDSVKPLDREGKAPAKLPAGRWWWDAAK